MHLVPDVEEPQEVSDFTPPQFPVIYLRDDRVSEISFFEREVSQGLTEFICQIVTQKGRFEGMGLSPFMALDDAIKSYFYT